MKSKKHKLILPEKSKDPFVLKFEPWEKIKRPFSWEPGYPLHTERDYIIVHEAASILTTKKIIRREGVDGIQQTRKWIRAGKLPNSYLFKNSKKYGYLIPKWDFAVLYEDMTGGDEFIEDKWIHCLLSEQNQSFIEYKEAEFRKKANLCKRKIELGGLSPNEIEKLKTEIEINNQKAKEYRKLWYKEVFGGQRGKG